jgi:hypothetical protein
LVVASLTAAGVPTLRHRRPRPVGAQLPIAAPGPLSRKLSRERGLGPRVNRRRGGYVENMSAFVPGPGVRASAIGDLLGALETLVAQYQSLPDTERERRWSSEAERVTGEVARHLDVARGKVRSAFVTPTTTD